jgi:3',5'-cyclic AMP phosphodiesterase CpdA
MCRRWLVSLGLTVAVGFSSGCDAERGLLLPARDSDRPDTAGLTLVARLVHLTDTHIVDEESPARFAGAHQITPSAWRPYESYSTQLFDGIIRTVNRVHASGRTIDFLIHTGDACDNAQSNELAWLIGVLDGAAIDPRSGPDDRPADMRPEPALDPHAPFTAQGLYRADHHGDWPSIPWYALFGNHDVYAIGVFPIFESPDGHRTAPLPLGFRPGLVLPVRLDPVGSAAYGNVTPGDPGPPCLFETPRYVEPNPQRAFFSKRELVRSLSGTVTEPSGHGFFDAESARSWYSVRPLAGVRLIGLDTTDRSGHAPGCPYSEGALSREQLEFLRQELDSASQHGELAIVASHHPTPALLRASGSQVLPAELRDLLGACRAVVLHLAGHRHRNRVTDRGTYLEIETCSTLDLPQEGRLIEIWRNADGGIVITYEMFSHIDDTLPDLGDDPLRALRETARSIALGDQQAADRQKRYDPSGQDPCGTADDRQGMVILAR